MDIRSAFSEALHTQPKLASSRNPEEFLGEFIYPLPPGGTPLFHILSCGNITASFPWTFDLKGMDCFMLLYTRQGSGKLCVNESNYALTPSTLLILNCNQHIRFDITSDPWVYQVFFLEGVQLPYYSSLLPKEKLLLLPITVYTNLLMALERILPDQISGEGLTAQLTISDRINHLLTSCITASLSDGQEPRQIPSYIRSMKELFDTQFENPYSLDELEDTLGISKYRLCREFGTIYHMPPLQYLNRRRIEAAAYLLTRSEDRIHQIGSRVGIDNTNHFIHLFKKYMGCTPLEYKQRMAR